MSVRRLATLLLPLLLAACATQKPAPGTPAPGTPAEPARYTRASFNDLPGWQQDDPRPGWQAWLVSCRTLAKRADWKSACQAAQRVDGQNPQAIRDYFAQRFTVWQLSSGSAATGLITGYYEPMLTGSRQRTAQSTVPLYAPPRDLVSRPPELQTVSSTGPLQRSRRDGSRLVPYYTAADIAAGKGPSPTEALVWVNDPIEAIFLQIQGSGRVQLADGSFVRLGFADHNGYPYQSIGRYLIQKGELKSHQASMQGIQDWARRNPERLPELYAANPRYVFFRPLPDTGEGPIGAMGLPLTGEASLAIDPRYIPLGTPVWLATTRPNSSAPLNRLMAAQDTGTAIKGAVRADFFWGFGQEAGETAGRMKQSGRLWVLLPNEVRPPAGMDIR
ncbi:murein transglycosylase A [Laribacter hongkongensis]|uniref:murein transglycosylase A n=1 Tax=Laribacter hongkongensis TaxID=168471 RepID=UPI001EFED453|nr:MltA domain-containing protein [Laribacter hongkongensis]MCG9076360.1 MltA domain-containing protein [Laribacter hongkongensis]